MFSMEAYVSLFLPLNKTNKKGYCDFLSHNSDFFFSELRDINSQLWVLKSELTYR